MADKFDSWLERVTLLLRGSEMPGPFVTQWLGKRRHMRRLYHQQYAPADVLMHLRRKHAEWCRLYEHGQSCRANRQWVRYAAYRLGYDLHSPAKPFKSMVLVVGIIALLLLIVGAIVWGVM